MAELDGVRLFALGVGGMIVFRNERIGVDLVIGILIVAVALLFVGIALDAARRK
jgi:NADH:ubiquinone oxidoreductase subunit K